MTKTKPPICSSTSISDIKKTKSFNSANKNANMPEMKK